MVALSSLDSLPPTCARLTKTSDAGEKYLMDRLDSNPQELIMQNSGEVKVSQIASKAYATDLQIPTISF